MVQKTKKLEVCGAIEQQDSSNHQNIFEKDKIYWFSKDGAIVEDGKQTDESIPLIKLKIIKKGSNDEECMKKMIFDMNLPENPKGWKFWLERKITKCDRTNPLSVKYMRIHVLIKNKIVKKAVWILKKFFGRYILKDFDSIEAVPHNNHIRMFYYCYEKALFDALCGIPYDANKVRPEAIQHNLMNREEYEKWVKENKFWSYQNRMDLMKLYLAEVLVDTFDREHLNYSVLNLYWTLNEHYKGNVPKPGEYPVYTAKGPTNYIYFKRMKDYSLWNPAESKKEEIKKE
ncbi:MAG: hypothetical protein ACOYWZ_14205 [Bacillota bacterium]